MLTVGVYVMWVCDWDVYRYVHIQGEADHVQPSERSMQMLDLEPQSEHALTVRSLKSFVLKGKYTLLIAHTTNTPHTLS